MKILSVFKNVFLACALLAAVAGCTKEDDTGLTGKWTFSGFSFGEMPSTRVALDEEDWMDKVNEWRDQKQDMNEIRKALEFNYNLYQHFDGLTLTFGKKRTFSFSLNGSFMSMKFQKISEEEISVKNGEDIASFTYSISEERFTLSIPRDAWGMMGDILSNELRASSVAGIIITFTKDV
jgi:hypothetical protein